MTRFSRPVPSILDGKQRWKVVDGRQVWKDENGERYYTWDSLHGEVEAFNKRGFHLGSLDAVSGAPLKGAVRGRRLDVQ
jgi:hypothetical protein